MITLLTEPVMDTVLIGYKLKGAAHKRSKSSVQGMKKPRQPIALLFD